MSTTLFKPAESQDIDRAIGRMALSFQREIDEYVLQTYREVLMDLPLWAIEGAELHLRRSGGAFFPSAAEWHMLAQDLIDQKQREILSKPVQAQQCDACRDTGWIEITENGVERCRPCSCREWNLNYQRTTKSSQRPRSAEKAK